MDLEKLTTEAIEVVKETGKFITREKEGFMISSIESKGTHNFVTHVDKGAEEKLVKGLSELLPASGFIAEEGTGKEEKGSFNWVIDPLDGTTNFIHGSPPYAVSVALMNGNRILLGIVYEITNGEIFHSFLEAPAYLNSEVIKVSNVGKVSDSLIATGFPYSSYGRMEPFMKTLDHFFLNSHGVRRLGSAATDLAYVACGRYDAFYEYNLKPWDVAAGAFLVQQAGGKIGDFRGGEDYLFGGEIVASNDKIFNEFQQAVGMFMNI